MTVKNTSPAKERTMGLVVINDIVTVRRHGIFAVNAAHGVMLESSCSRRIVYQYYN